MQRKRKETEHTVALHDGEELDDDLGGRADQDLALAGLLGVVDSIQAVVENGSLDHFGGDRFSMAGGRLRYLRKWLWLASRCQSVESALSAAA